MRTFAVLNMKGGVGKTTTAIQRLDMIPASDLLWGLDADPVGQCKTETQGISGVRRVIEAKAILSHGKWLPWLEEKADFSERTAQGFMALARAYSNPQTLADLGASKALALLALPGQERDDFVAASHVVGGQEKTVEEMTTRELSQADREARETAESEVTPDRGREAALVKPAIMVKNAAVGRYWQNVLERMEGLNPSGRVRLAQKRAEAAAKAADPEGNLFGD